MLHKKQQQQVEPEQNNQSQLMQLQVIQQQQQQQVEILQKQQQPSPEQQQQQQQQQRGATPDASFSVLRSTDFQLPVSVSASVQPLRPSSLSQSSLQPGVGGAATPPLRRTVDSVTTLQKQQQQQQMRPLTPDFSAPVVSPASHSFSVRFSDDVAQVTL
jgi:hypothetical protein